MPTSPLPSRRRDFRSAPAAIGGLPTGAPRSNQRHINWKRPVGKSLALSSAASCIHRRTCVMSTDEELDRKLQEDMTTDGCPNDPPDEQR